ncbi:hypothetical protein TVAG_474970 [Trichomonas vaginalis G3]|uniref:Uncharacterized protein n=1 Tax=Trichomonas vaginalis (strain ATCC PRA-98 / G3) TaxID=412133 RepID=A2ERP7_TRIV3|nr:centrosomal protein-related family [Trichomonas vaginalis G3]EAY04699.1 hypothetical protein TVAG_474970 [Trichomonas vaginalis G3]KAI5530890.1 centrosomal protein-related family [Trichomonas vaginalis G3]|eukprot:XP_001316922.1 hypothetical protein [Trichomonas vaginalis G3]
MSTDENVIVRSEALLDRVRTQMSQGNIIAPNIKIEQTLPFVPQLDESMGISSAGGGAEPPLSPVKPPPGDPQTQTRYKQYFISGKIETETVITHEYYLHGSVPSSPGGMSTHPVSRYQTARSNNRLENPDEEIPDIDTEFVISKAQCYHLQKTPNDVAKNMYIKANQLPDKVQHKTPLPGGRDIAAEGYFVPNEPLVKKGNKTRLENRLLWDDPNGQYFFGADGNMRNDTPNVVEISPEFPIKAKKGDQLKEPEVKPEDQLEFNPAAVWGVQDVDVSRMIRIEIPKVTFLTHPLSTLEDLLDSRIRQLYDAIMRDADAPIAKYYKNRIKALRNEMARCDESPQGLAKERQLLEDILKFHEEKDKAEASLRQQREELVTTYKELQDYRRIVGYGIHSLGLKWQVRNFTAAEKEKQEQNFENHLGHRAEEIVRYAQLNGEEKQIDAVIEELRQNHAKLGLHLPGDPLWRPVLTENEDVTPLVNCPEKEKQRRQRLQAAKIYVRVKIGAETNITSLQVPLSRDFVALPDLAIEVEVTKVPENVICEIWETGYVRPRQIAVVNLATSVGMPVVDDVYEFTARPPSGKGRMTIGTVYARSFVMPCPQERILVKPPTSDEESKKQLAQDPSRFMSVPKLLEWADTHDPNDPYVSSMLAGVKAQRNQERVAGRFKLDPLQEQTLFSSFSPSTITQQIQQHIIRIQRQQIDEEMRRLKEEQMVTEEQKVDDQLTLANIIQEIEPPSGSSIWRAIKDFFRKSRPLHPVPEDGIPTNSLCEYSQLVIRVVRALNIPLRTQFGLGPDYDDAQHQLFVRICLDNDVRLTRIADNDWNELIRFNLVNEGEEIPSMNDVASKLIRIDLFDRVDFSQNLFEERFLGSLELPMTAVWSTGELTGRFPLNTPPIQLAYFSENASPIGLVASIAIKPRIADPPTANPYTSLESLEIRERANRFTTKLNKKSFDYPRQFRVMCARDDGLSVLLCRYIYSLNPPETIKTPLQAVRFVSSIPFVPDAQQYHTAGDVWLSCKEFLDSHSGDEEEHAILLCCFLKALGRDTYVIIGSDVLNGSACYVMIKHSDHIAIIDPVRGNFFDARETSCTLTSIGVVFNESNIWCNVQKAVTPWQVDWNLENKKNWIPFFDNKFQFTPLHEDANEQINYDKPNEEEAKNIQADIEANLRAAIEEDRGGEPTNWNNDIQKVIEKSLAMIIEKENGEQVVDMSEPLHFLEENLADYRVIGAPFAAPFTSVDRITDEVRAQGTFLTLADGVEFALSVKVLPLPHELYLAWVFLVAAVKCEGGNLNRVVDEEESYNEEEEQPNENEQSRSINNEQQQQQKEENKQNQNNEENKQQQNDEENKDSEKEDAIVVDEPADDEPPLSEDDI